MTCLMPDLCRPHITRIAAHINLGKSDVGQCSGTWRPLQAHRLTVPSRPDIHTEKPTGSPDQTKRTETTIDFTTQRPKLVLFIAKIAKHAQLGNNPVTYVHRCTLQRHVGARAALILAMTKTETPAKTRKSSSVHEICGIGKLIAIGQTTSIRFGVTDAGSNLTINQSTLMQNPIRTHAIR